MGWVGFSHLELQGEGRLCQAGPAQHRGVCVTQGWGHSGHISKFCWGWGGDKENARKTELIQLKERAAAAEGAGARGEVSHTMLRVTKNSIYSIVLSVLLSTGPGVFQGQGMVPEPGNGSRAQQQQLQRVCALLLSRPDATAPGHP